MPRKVINIRTNANNTSGKKNDTQGNNQDSLLKKKTRNEPRQKKCLSPTLVEIKKIRIIIKERALQNTEGNLSHYFRESKSCPDIYRDNQADGA